MMIQTLIVFNFASFQTTSSCSWSFANVCWRKAQFRNVLFMSHTCSMSDKSGDFASHDNKFASECWGVETSLVNCILKCLTKNNLILFHIHKHSSNSAVNINNCSLDHSIPPLLDDDLWTVQSVTAPKILLIMATNLHWKIRNDPK